MHTIKILAHKFVSASVSISISFLANSASSQTFEDHPCAYQDHYYVSLNSTVDQQYIYEELEAGSPLSDARFSYWDKGRKVWSAHAERLCTSAGVSFCGVSLPFPAGDILTTHVGAPMTTFQTQHGESFVVFAHLWESSYSSLRYHYRHLDFPYLGIFEGSNATDRVQFALPNVYEKRSCLIS